MGVVLDFPEDAARRLRPKHLPLSPYYAAELRFVASLELMARFCIGFLVARTTSPSYPVRVAVDAVDGFIIQTPKFTQAWTLEGKDLNMVQFLVAANRHACQLRTALEKVRASIGIRPEDAAAVQRELEAVGTYVEGVLDRPLTAIPARL